MSNPNTTDANGSGSSEGLDEESTEPEGQKAVETLSTSEVEITTLTTSTSFDSLLSLPWEVVGCGILECLTAVELGRISLVNKKLNLLAQSDGLWKKLIFLDFGGEKLKNVGFIGSSLNNESSSNGFSKQLFRQNSSSGSSRSLGSNYESKSSASQRSNRQNSSSRNIQSVGPDNSYCRNRENLKRENNLKKMYVSYLTGYQSNFQKAREEKEWKEKWEKTENQKRKLLIFSLVSNQKILTPLLGLLPFITLVLLMLKLGEAESMLNKSFWVVFSPIFLLLALIAASIVNSSLLYCRRKDQGIWNNLWNQYRGIVRGFMVEILGDSRRALFSGLLFYLSFVIFWILLCYKLEADSFVDVAVNSSLNATSYQTDGKDGITWSTGVFVPVWVMLVIVLLSRLLEWRVSVGHFESYVTVMGVVWAPVVAFFVMLGLYLDDIINVYVCAVLLPILSQLAVIFCVTIAYLIYCIYKKDTSGGCYVFIFSLLLLSPIIAFLVMLSLNYPPFHESFSTLTVLSPLAAWFLAFSVVLMIISLTTPLPVACRPRRPMTITGTPGFVSPRNHFYESGSSRHHSNRNYRVRIYGSNQSVTSGDILTNNQRQLLNV